MNISPWGLLSFLLLFQANVSGQKLKKADRTIVANLQTHVNSINGGNKGERSAGSAGEKAAIEYISKQFTKFGLKPLGDGNSWYQQFTIYDGKEILPSTFLSINGRKLRLHNEYFPFAFSANKKADAAVAIALAENGVPWFKDLKEITDKDSDDTSKLDTVQLIRQKAIAAADKGASAFIVYTTGEKDLVYDKLDKSPDVPIPVIYIAKDAFKKYCSDESAIIDVALQVDKRAKERTGINVIAFEDNNADSTIITGAHLDNDNEVAALLEVARLVKLSKSRGKNYLFVAFCSEQNTSPGIVFYKEHPKVDPSKIKRVVYLDSVTVSNNNPKGLHLVRQSVDLIK